MRDVEAKLRELQTLRARLTLRAELLPADLALAGLVDDLIGAASTVAQLSQGDDSLAAYPLTRMAFEAAQRVVALATDDDYLRTGTRAWLYYHRKDARILRQTAGKEHTAAWLDSAVADLQRAWAPHNTAADQLITEELDRLAANGKSHKPDNFMGRDLADLVQERYSRVLRGAGPALPDLKSLNRAIYGALSRESHARLRVDVEALEISSEGEVHIIPRRVDQAAKLTSLLGSLDSSLAEANGALAYLLERRSRDDMQRVRHAAQEIDEGQLRPGWKPDLGLELARRGGANTAFHFWRVPIRRIGILEDGAVSWSANVVLSGGEYIATFDVPPSLLEVFASAVDLAPDSLAADGTAEKRTLTSEVRVRLKCRLGRLQDNGDQQFIPLLITQIEPDIAPSGGA